MAQVSYLFCSCAILHVTAPVLAAGSTVCDPFFNAVLLCDDDDALWPKTLHCNASQLIQGVFCCSAADALLMYCLRTAVCACVYAESKEVFALDPIRMRELVLQGPDITWLVSRGGRGGGQVVVGRDGSRQEQT